MRAGNNNSEIQGPRVAEPGGAASHARLSGGTPGPADPGGGRGGGTLPRRVLILFSGPLNRPDGLGAELRELGFEVVEVDEEF